MGEAKCDGLPAGGYPSLQELRGYPPFEYYVNIQQLAKYGLVEKVQSGFESTQN
jgi:hypothetical protein